MIAASVNSDLDAVLAAESKIGIDAGFARKNFTWAAALAVRLADRNTAAAAVNPYR